jgi:hypothetical protein
MKKTILLTFVVTLSILTRAQHLETTIKVVNGKARIAVKAVGGDIKGSPSGVTFCIAIPAANALTTLDYPMILDASRLPVEGSLTTGSYLDGTYKYFMLLWAGGSAPVTFANNTEYELLELTWSGPEKDFPVSLISLAQGNSSASVLPSQWINYFEVGGIQYSFGDKLFYQSPTSTEPVQMVSDYSSGKASVTGKIGNAIVNVDRPKTLAIDGLFPNPASTMINVIIGAPNKDKVTLVVTDIGGRTVKQKLVNVDIGSNTIPVEISNLAQGSYMVKLLCQSSDCETAVQKFNKQ